MNVEKLIDKKQLAITDCKTVGRTYKKHMTYNKTYVRIKNMCQKNEILGPINMDNCML